MDELRAALQEMQREHGCDAVVAIPKVLGMLQRSVPAKRGKCYFADRFAVVLFWMHIVNKGSVNANYFETVPGGGLLFVDNTRSREIIFGAGISIKRARVFLTELGVNFSAAPCSLTAKHVATLLAAIFIEANARDNTVERIMDKLFHLVGMTRGKLFPVHKSAKLYPCFNTGDCGEGMGVIAYIGTLLDSNLGSGIFKIERAIEMGEEMNNVLARRIVGDELATYKQVDLATDADVAGKFETYTGTVATTSAGSKLLFSGVRKGTGQNAGQVLVLYGMLAFNADGQCVDSAAGDGEIVKITGADGVRVLWEKKLI